MRKSALLFATILLAASYNSLSAAGPYIGLLDSDVYARNYFTAHYNACDLASGDPNALGPDEYKRYFLGWKMVLDEMGFREGTEYEIIYDRTITSRGLLPYKVLILSNNVGLAEDQTETLRAWVNRGGRLLATFGTGYGAIVTDPKKGLQKGKTGSLPGLWGDSAAYAESTAVVGLNAPFYGSVEPLVTRFEGPARSLNASGPWYWPSLPGLLLGYGDNGNLLVQRPDSAPGVYAYLQFKNNLPMYDTDPDNDVDYARPIPAIIANAIKKGIVVYYSYAPEFIVSLEYDTAGHCPTDGNYSAQELAAPGLQAAHTQANNLFATRTNFGCGDDPTTPADESAAGCQNSVRGLMRSTIKFLLGMP